MKLVQFAEEVLKLKLEPTERWTLEALEHNPEGLLRVFSKSAHMRKILNIHKKWRNMLKAG